MVESSAGMNSTNYIRRMVYPGRRILHRHRKRIEFARGGIGR